MLLTKFERLNPSGGKLANHIVGLKGSIAGVMLPRDAQEIEEVENSYMMNKTEKSLEQRYEECLQKCLCMELV